MKRKAIIVLAVLILVSSALSGCVANPRQQLLEGISGLILGPLKEAVNFDGYPEGISGDIQELMQTQSHEMSVKAKVKEMDMGEAMRLPLGIELTGAYVELESAYDMQSGDMALDLGVGLGAGDIGSVKFLLKEDECALDAGKLLPSMYVLALDTGLDFKKPIPYQQRISDLIGQSGKEPKELVGELQVIIDDYVKFITENIDKKWVSLDKDTIDVFGKSEKCDTITLSVEGEDLHNLLVLVFEKAQDDDALASFVVDNFMTKIEDAEDEYGDAIDDVLDQLDDMDDDEIDDMALEVTVFFVKNAPVALEMAAEGSESDVELYWKYISRGLEKDLELTASVDGEEAAQVVYLNKLNKDVYEFEFEISAENMTMSGEGKQVHKKDSLTVEMDFDMDMDTGADKLSFSGTEEITWEAVKAGSEYELDGALSISGGDGVDNLSMSYTISGGIEFSKTVDVGIDEWDDDAIRVDSFEELFEQVMTQAFSVFGGFSGFEDFT